MKALMKPAGLALAAFAFLGAGQDVDAAVAAVAVPGKIQRKLKSVEIVTHPDGTTTTTVLCEGTGKDCTWNKKTKKWEIG